MTGTAAPRDLIGLLAEAVVDGGTDAFIVGFVGATDPGPDTAAVGYLLMARMLRGYLEDPYPKTTRPEGAIEFVCEQLRKIGAAVSALPATTDVGRAVKAVFALEEGAGERIRAGREPGEMLILALAEDVIARLI